MLGRGLGLKKEGSYVAYAAGTGVLVFIDLVAHLILRLISENGGVPDLLAIFQEPKIDLENFKFELHTSFQSDSQAIGLELIKALEKLRDKFEEKSDLFVHHPRGLGPRWEPSQIQEKATDEKVKKIWVCGPPQM